MPSKRFLWDMGVASVIAGVILLGMAHLVRFLPGGGRK